MKRVQTPRIILLFSLLAIMASCKTTAEKDVSHERILVRTAQTSLQPVATNLEFTGVVQPYEEAHIAPAMPARIKRILVDVGDKVTKGQLLIEMDNSQLYQAQVQFSNLTTELARIDTLLKAGAVTQQAYDQLKTQYEVSQSSIQNLSTHTQVRSTLNGVVTGRYFSDGEMFSGAPSPAGKPAIVSINQVQPVKVIIGVSERFLPEIKKGMEAEITTEVFSGRSFKGTINRIFPTIDRATGTFRVEIVIDNKDENLRPGMFARVSLNLGEHQALLVPALAIMKQAGSNERFVFVVQNEQAQRLTVEPGRKYDDNMEILSGLQPGQQLIITGQHNLIQGSDVEIVE
jgi:membrane fusion protein, multidrug efflux system